MIRLWHAPFFAAALLLTAAARADVNYSLDDGAAELAFGIDPGEDMVWMNTYPVDPGGWLVDSISVSYGRFLGPSALNGLPVTILLYEDTTGGSPADAVLKRSVSATVANGNTNTLNTYSITPTAISGTLVVGVLYRNTTTVNKFIGAVDTTAPSFPDRSYSGWAVGLDPANLAAIPAAQFGTLESFGSIGNFRIRAHAVPSPGLVGFAAVIACALPRRRAS